MARVYTGLFITLPLWLQSCGFKTPHASPVESGTVEIPAFNTPEQVSFALAAEPKAHNFQGHILIWATDVTPPLIRNVLDNSVQTRKERALTLDLIGGSWLRARQNMNLAQTALQEVEKRYSAALSAGFRADAVRREVTQPTARTWFARRLEELNQEAQGSDGWIKSHTGEIKQSFAAYCDAKIWEFAVSRLAVMSYKERPTPLGLCEDYYASADPTVGKVPYFQNTALCGPAAAAEGKDYFACLWQDALLLTPQFTYLRDNPDETCVRGGPAGSKAKAITSWAQSSPSGPSLLETIIRDEVAQPKLATAVMLAGSIPASTPDSLGKLYPDLKSCQLAFRRLDFDRTSRFDQASPGRLLAIGETDGVSTQQYALDLIPRREPSDEAKDAADYHRLTRLVRMFGWRVATKGGYSVSVSDLLFNQPVGFDLSEEDPSGALRRNKDAIIPNEAQSADPAFRAFVEIKNTYVSAILGQRSSVAQELAQVQATFKSVDDQLTVRSDLDRELSVAGLRAVNAPSALSFFQAFGLRLLREGNHLTASLTITRPITSCIDMEDSSTCKALAMSEDDVMGAQLSFEREANKLVFNIPLDNLKAIGLQGAPRTTEDRTHAETAPLAAFNDLAESELSGKHLQLIMYGNRLGKLDFFTGDVFVIDPTTGTKLHTGSINGDLFDETRRHMMDGSATKE